MNGAELPAGRVYTGHVRLFVFLSVCTDCQRHLLETSLSGVLSVAQRFLIVMLDSSIF